MTKINSEKKLGQKNDHKQPLVSVCIPCYNHEKYVKKCLDSVLLQSYSNIEILVLDDGSTDASWKIIEEYSKNAKFKVSKRQNRGLNETLSDLFALSKGDYVAVIASDDFWHPEKLKLHIESMENNNEIRLSFSGFYCVDQNDKILRAGDYFRNDKGCYSFDDIIRTGNMPLAGTIFKKKYLGEGRFVFPPGVVDDLYLWLKILETGGAAIILPDGLSYYRLHSSNTFKNTTRLVDLHIATIQAFKDVCDDWRGIEAQWALRNAYLLARIEKRRAISFLMKAMQRPSCLFGLTALKLFAKLVFCW